MAADKKNKEPSKWVNMLGLGVLVLAYLTATYNMLGARKLASDDKNTIRIVHWQLESGVRDALDEMAKRFSEEYKEKFGEEIKVIQIPVNENAYRQYVTTQCVGGTPPDLIEMGRMDPQMEARFFEPMTKYLFEPNPYNKGTELENVKWKDTFYDGLQSSFDELSLEYYSIGFSTFTTRMFYNKNIFQEALGHTNPPKDFNDLIEMCDKLIAWGKKKKIDGFVPIAAAGYQVGMMRGRYENSVIMPLTLQHDMNHDGVFDETERLIAYNNGDYSYTDPSIKAGQDMVIQLTNYFSPGFMGTQRSESANRFSQGKSAFIISGSWDAYSFMLRSKSPLGICDFPIPTKDDPKVGHLVRGRITEADSKTGFRFGITRSTKNKKAAIRFLQFMTSRQRNEEFNELFKWLPVINGAEPHKSIEVFKPISEGFYSTDPFKIGGKTGMIATQYYWKFLSHDITYDEFIKNLVDKMPAAQAADLGRHKNYYDEDYETQGGRLSAGLADAAFSEDKVKAEARTAFVWEARAGKALEGARRFTLWKKLVDEKKPRALKVMKYYGK